MLLMLLYIETFVKRFSDFSDFFVFWRSRFLQTVCRLLQSGFTLQHGFIMTIAAEQHIFLP